MEALADAWSSLTAAAYEQRVLLALLTVLVVVITAVVAVRRGWWAAARRHPARSLVLGGAVLAVGLPLAWYMVSPLWIRTTLEEPPVVAAAVPTPSVAPARPSLTAPADPRAASADPTTRPSPTPDPTPTASPTATPFAVRTVAAGEFSGTDDFHFGRGTATILEIEPGRYHLRLEDFSVRNGPDLFVYLSPKANGYAKGALELGRLKATDGSFGYDLPAGADPTTYRSAIIWCKQFAHLFATAPLEG